MATTCTVCGETAVDNAAHQATTGHAPTFLPENVVVDGLYCDDCTEGFSPDQAVTVYECGNCSERDEERRCTSCNRFMAKATDTGCPNCYGDLEERELALDHDGTLVLPEDYSPDGQSAADRKAAAHARAARERAEREQAEREQAEANAVRLPWGQVRPGHALLVDGEAETVAYVAPSPDGTHAMVVTDEYGPRVYARPAGRDVLVVSTDVTPVTRPWGVWSLSDEPIDIASSASTQASVVIDRRGNSETAFLPTLTLCAESGNYLHRLGVFADAATATRAFDVLEAAAMRLHALYGTTPDETITVPVTEEERFISDRPSAGGVVKVGHSDWVRADHILTVVVASQSITLTDPDVVLALVRAGRGALDVLTVVPTREPLR